MKQSLNPKNYTLSAIILGYILIGNYSANEQNAIGNWFMTIGQILEANAAIQMTIEDKCIGNSVNINSKQFKNGGSIYMHNKGLLDELSPSEEEINDIKKILNDLLNKINHL